VGSKTFSQLAYKTTPLTLSDLSQVVAFQLLAAHNAKLATRKQVMASKILYVAVAAAVAVSSFAGVAFAADAPAPSPTSGAAAVSSSLVAAVLCPAVALLVGNLRH
jgi:hypothetical protein